MRPWTLPVVAGFFDTDGGFYIHKDGGTEVRVTNKNRDALRESMYVLNVSRPIELLPHRRGNRESCYYWRAYGITADGVARALLPYLVTKRAQARLTVLWRERGMRGGCWNEATRIAVQKKLDYLNSRGTVGMAGRDRRG